MKECREHRRSAAAAACAVWSDVPGNELVLSTALQRGERREERAGSCSRSSSRGAPSAPARAVPGRSGGRGRQSRHPQGAGAGRSRARQRRRRGGGRGIPAGSGRRARCGPSMSEKKQPVDLGLLEEDDEFEEFPAEDWTGLDEDEDAHVWEDNWDDDNVEDDFSNQLRAELEKHGYKMETS
ncbi:uncharacterized protein LOC129124686 [Agelaius phoeniceus]|uniref:uncharacterized protein LOC129124686 n=1 Tax=Agelaius phoeniceus TaxID=39638 RepID=UPI004054B2BB